MKKIVLLIILIISTSIIFGQNNQNDERIVPIEQKFQEANWVTTITDLDFSNIILLSSFDWQAIKHEDSIRYNQKLPTRIGMSIAIDVDLLNDIIPIEEDGYYIYRYKVFAEGAKKVGFVFDDFFLQPGDAIYIINEDGQFIGPITDVENKEFKMYSTVP
ncbi:MAG: hypothetical protein WBL11_05490, partial [Bacteroidales bacterium]